MFPKAILLALSESCDLPVKCGMQLLSSGFLGCWARRQDSSRIRNLDGSLSTSQLRLWT